MAKLEEVEQKLESLKLRTAQVQLEQAEMQLEQTKETVTRWKTERDERSRHNAARQKQLGTDINERAGKARGCTHRQGGSFMNPYGGKGPSALNVVILPDDRTLIMCSICPLRVFSPFPADVARKPRRGETPEAAEARVKKFEADSEAFALLVEQSRDKLTEEAAAPMHCGKQFQFRDGDGNQVQILAPCDKYAQGLDNRKGVRA